MYFPKFNMCTSLTEILHFPLSLLVRTSLLRMFPLYFMQFMRDFALPKLNLCTSHRTSHSPIFVHSFIWYYHFLTQFYGFVYFPKFNTCTSRTETSYFSLSLRVLPSFYRRFFYFSLQFTGDSYFQKSIFGLLSAKSSILRAGENQSQLKHKYF
jgi:hypothetical protein